MADDEAAPAPKRGRDAMQLFDSAAVKDLLKPPPGAHDWSVHEVGDPGSGRLLRACSRCGVEQPYPGRSGGAPVHPPAELRKKPPADP